MSNRVGGVPGSLLKLRSNAKRATSRTLSGSVAKVGLLDGRPLLGVRLRAIVCVSSPEAAYPSAIGVTHYAVYKRRLAERCDEMARDRYLLPEDNERVLAAAEKRKGMFPAE